MGGNFKVHVNNSNEIIFQNEPRIGGGTVVNPYTQAAVSGTLSFQDDSPFVEEGPYSIPSTNGYTIRDGLSARYYYYTVTLNGVTSTPFRLRINNDNPVDTLSLGFLIKGAGGDATISYTLAAEPAGSWVFQTDTSVTLAFSTTPPFTLNGNPISDSLDLNEGAYTFVVDTNAGGRYPFTIKGKRDDGQTEGATGSGDIFIYDPGDVEDDGLRHLGEI